MGTRNTPLALTLSITALLGGCLNVEQPLGEDTGTGGSSSDGSEGSGGCFTYSSPEGEQIINTCDWPPPETGGYLIRGCEFGNDPDGSGGISCNADGTMEDNCWGIDPDGSGGIAVGNCEPTVATGGVMVDPCDYGMDPDGSGGIDCGTPATSGGTTSGGVMGCGGYHDSDGAGGMTPVDDCGIPIEPPDPCEFGMDPDGAGGVDCGTPATSGGSVGSGGVMGCGGYHDPDGFGGVVAVDDCGSPVRMPGEACGCAASEDVCVVSYCDAPATCVYEDTATGPDNDGDGIPSGCDCDDSNADVFPGQTAYFGLEVPGFADPNDPGMMLDDGSAYDYDCDGTGVPQLATLAADCAPLEGAPACIGDGWVDEGSGVPHCGATGLYRDCQYQDGTCVAFEAMAMQRCR